MGSYSFGTTVCAWPAMLDIVSLTSDQRLHPPWWPHGLGTAANAIAISRETVQALKRANDTIANMDRLKKYMTREFASYVGRHMEHKYPETTKRNSSALSSTTCTTRTMYFSSNRRAGATVMTDAGAALQKASDVPADCRVSLTPDKFAALRVDSAGQVLLETMPCDEITVATNYLASAQLVAWRTALALHCAAAARQRSPNDDDDDKQCQREYWKTL